MVELPFHLSSLSLIRGDAGMWCCQIDSGPFSRSLPLRFRGGREFDNPSTTVRFRYHTTDTLSFAARRAHVCVRTSSSVLRSAHSSQTRGPSKEHRSRPARTFTKMQGSCSAGPVPKLSTISASLPSITIDRNGHRNNSNKWSAQIVQGVSDPNLLNGLCCKLSQLS